MYQWLKPLLFKIDPEKAHHLTMKALIFAGAVPGMKPLLRSFFKPSGQKFERTIAGLTFKNPLGLAAGFDKDGKYLHAMMDLGFSHIEIGTVTPRPQPGNPKPRLFRLPGSKALINRMGFNNEGVEALAQRLMKPRSSDCIVGANIGKNKDTPNEEAVKDYLSCFQRLYDLVDYFTVNVSSPNTPGLRALQDREPLQNLLSTLQQHNLKNKPVFLKIAPDVTHEQLDEIIEIIQATRLSGLIATNTTIERKPLVEDEKWVADIGAGGLSGTPLLERSVDVVGYIRSKSKGEFYIIGVGGISDGNSAQMHLDAGADLIQVYTGLIYTGPSIVKKIMRYLSK